MTKLEQLLSNAITISADIKPIIGEYNSYGNWKDKWIKKAAKKLSDKYSVTLKEHDSSADNNKVEQSINQEQMMSQIEDMINLITNRMLDNSDRDNVEECYKLSELFNQLKTHRNAISTAVKQKVDNLVDWKELLLKIERLICHTTIKTGHYQGMNVIDGWEVVERLLELFKNYHKYDSKPCNSANE